jgi:glycosyltransferase involved in cell wall biosynthesis
MNLAYTATKIVMLTPDRQVDRRILLEADTLEASGHSVKIIAMPSDSGTSEVDRRITRIGSEGQVAGTESMALHLYRWVRKFLPMDSAPMRFLKTLVWRYAFDQEAFYLDLFLPVASQFEAHVFMAHDLPVLPVAHALSRRCNAKLVYDSHELFSEQEFSNYEKRRWAKIETKYIRDCDAVITVNPSIANELEHRYGIQHVNVIYNAERTSDPPVKQALFHEAFGLPAGKKILLFQGGLSAGRNLEVLVEATGLVRNPYLNLVILGDGQLGDSLKNMVKARKLGDRVHFHPAVPQGDLLRYSACADAGIIPYQAICLNNYYCTPNKLFEFIAAGVPILASDLPEIRNLIETHRIGLVGDLSTTEKTAKQIDDFFSNPMRLKQWQDNVLRARQHVCWENESKKLVKIFDQLK